MLLTGYIYDTTDFRWVVFKAAAFYYEAAVLLKDFNAVVKNAA